jgi:hypothetical protein
LRNRKGEYYIEWNQKFPTKILKNLIWESEK